MLSDDYQKDMKILAIDDEETALRLYQGVLREDGHKVDVAMTGQEGIDKVNQGNYDLIILDLKLPDIFGTDLLKKIVDKITWIPVIIITAHPSLESSIDAIRTGGVHEYIIKPFGAEDLKLAVRRVVEKNSLMIENQRLLTKLERANQALSQRVDELEKCARIAQNYEQKVEELQQKIKTLEKGSNPLDI